MTQEELAFLTKSDAPTKDSIWRGIAGPGETAVLPMGSFTVERTVADTGKADAGPAIGLRLHYLEGEESTGSKSLTTLMGDQEAQNIEGDQTLSFWTAVVKGITSGSEK